MISFTDIFIKRPVLAMVLSIFIFILGLRAIFVMQVRQYPKMDNTVITITTAYPGASAQVIQGFVTTPIEKSIASADGIDYFTSNSDTGVSTIAVNVTLNYDPNKAFTDIMSKVAQVEGQLPQSAQQPVITKSTGSSIQLMYLSFSSSAMDPEQITSYLNTIIRPKIQTVQGVAGVDVMGGSDYAMRIWLNPIKMAALGVSPTEVSQALRNSNYQSAAGRIQGKYIYITVNAQTSLSSEQGFKNLIVKHSKGALVHLRDVAKVQLASQNYDSSVFFNGKKGVFLAISQTPTANPLTVIDNVRKILPRLKKDFPPGLTMSIVYDATKFINASIYEVIQTIVEASIIVFLVMFLFLGSFRAVSIPVITIPLSLVGVFGFMLAMGYSINLLTLLALVLAIGLVVDDAIVVVENTFRHIEEGMPVFDAALVAARDIAMPIIAMTVTLAAVYVPIGFMQGITGALFKEFAFTLAGAVLVSGFIALTLSPMMCSRILLTAGNQSRLSVSIESFFNALKNAYSKRLAVILNYRKLTISFALFILVSCVFLYANAPKEMAPVEDQGVVLSFMSGPKYANLDYMQKYTNPFFGYYSKIPSKEYSFTVNGMQGVNTGLSMLILKPWGKRKQTQADVVKAITQMGQTNPGLQVQTFPFPALPVTGMGLPIQFELITTASYPDLYAAMSAMVRKAQISGKFMFISGSLHYNKPTVDVKIDRDKAALLGINMQTLGQDLQAALSGGYINWFPMFNRSFQVIPQLEREFRTNADQLGHIYVHTASGTLVPIKEIASLTFETKPDVLTRFNQLNSAEISGMMMPGQTIDSALSYLKQLANKTLPNNISYDFSGQSRQYEQEGSALLYAFAFSLIVIFLVLAAQFESFASPLVIMLTVPMAICGALLPFSWYAMKPLITINLYTQIGLITLVGLISKHGILMVDFANKLREKSSLDPVEAIQQAAAVRLRPILMTTAAMVLGVMPLLFASGAGAVSRFDIGLTIAMGMTIGTIFTLFIIPTMYCLKPRKIVMFLLAAATIVVALYYGLYVY